MRRYRLINRRFFLHSCTNRIPAIITMAAVISTIAKTASTAVIRHDEEQISAPPPSTRTPAERAPANHPDRSPRSLTVSEQEQLRAVSTRIKSLPANEREQFRISLLKWRELTPSQREKLRNRWKRFRSLPPDQQEKLRRRFASWRRLSPEEQQALDRAIKRRQGS